MVPRLVFAQNPTNRATKCDVIRPSAKPNNHVSGSKQLKYTPVNYEFFAVSETIKLQCWDIHLKYQYKLMNLVVFLFYILNIESADFG